MSHPLSIAFIWHMHQPPYRDPVTGGCTMPWVRLHATKDYLDMVKRLEPFPTIHQTFNLVPSLLDQLEEYLPALSAVPSGTGQAGAPSEQQLGAAPASPAADATAGRQAGLPPANRSDDFLEISKKPAAGLTEGESRFIVQWFFLANPEHMIKPYPRYHDLLAKRGHHLTEEDWPGVLRRFKTQDLLDLQVWFNLAWIDPWLRRQDPRLHAMEQKGARFTEEDKAVVLAAHLSLIAQVIPAYQEAAKRGQVELTTSPYYHPILPLLCDLKSALVALPNLQLPPMSFRHPQDALRQLEEGIGRHEAAFGVPPQGLWPPEGSVSEDVVRLALDARVQWMATDEEILWRTLKTPRSPGTLYRPHLVRRGERQLALVFRDRELSDRIGFVYSRWEPSAAVADFLKRLEEIRQQVRTMKTPPLVSVILDGENAWEHYPDDGHDFLMGLYEALAKDERFRCVTVNEFLRQYSLDQATSLPALFAGSWIDANFATWVGHPEKNTAWSYLSAAHEAIAGCKLDDVAQHRVQQSLGMAEASDWMWWFGDTHVSAQAEEFDRLFRTHLANCYRLAGLEVPQTLEQPIRRRAPAAVHEPSSLLRVTIDGRETSYYEWLYAGMVDLKQQYGAIHRGVQVLQRLWYGFDEHRYYLRLDVELEELAKLAPWTLEIAGSRGLAVRVTPAAQGLSAQLLGPSPDPLPCALGRLIELAVPLDRLSLREGESLELAVTLSRSGDMVERYPSEGHFTLVASPAALQAQAWSA